MENIRNKNIVVTGCTGGIGSSVCRLLKINGAKIIGISRGIQPSAEIINLSDLFVSHNLEVPLPAGKINEVVTESGKIDCLIHTAGLLIPSQLIDLSESEIISLINANLLSTIHIIKAVLPVMKQQGSGQIIVVGSLGGIIPMPYESVYAAAKFGVRGLCLSLVEELKKDGIKISLVSAGPVKTQMLDKESADENSVVTFIAKPLSPECIANAIVKLILHPKTEVILPGYSRIISILLNYLPGLFYKIFTLIKPVGRRRLNQYRSEYLQKIISE